MMLSSASGLPLDGHFLHIMASPPSKKLRKGGLEFRPSTPRSPRSRHGSTRNASIGEGPIDENRSCSTHQALSREQGVITDEGYSTPPKRPKEVSSPPWLPRKRAGSVKDQFNRVATESADMPRRALFVDDC
ncbi:hypothetical protein FOZ60_001798 [Perkinsus olseni]|uniref:Uncharacterized protein n=1 Tax=Perkinsus olseni TaxID=32597 RepID=A0A7J6NZH9_PEROL|nr:hypothetical protein FOZ60_001798 [Perkinsus olseni]